MRFKINKQKVILNVIGLMCLVIAMDYLVTSINLLVFDVFIISIGIVVIYLIAQIYSEVYQITEDAIVLEKAGVAIPLGEINEVVRRFDLKLRYLRLFSKDIGYQYFVIYEGCEYELMSVCRNEKDESVHEVLNKKFQKEYRDVKGLKLLVKVKDKKHRRI